MRLHAILTLPGVRRYIFDDEIISTEQTGAIVDKSVALYRERGLGLWMASPSGSTARRSSVPSAIGFGGFWHFREPPELELLYGVVDDEVGHGYGCEIAQAIVSYGFDTLNMPTIRASCDADHRVSRKLLESTGFCLVREARVADLDTAFYELQKGASAFLLDA